MTIYYAGIGSRKAPEYVLNVMFNLGKYLAEKDYTLRSGAAEGADTYFELGCDSVNGKKEIWLPWKNFNKHEDTKLYPTDKHKEKAKSIISHWDKLSNGGKLLHSRNIGQILGMDINTPVSFVICWTPDGCESKEQYSKKTGGTGTAIVLADEYNIPVINLFNNKSKLKLVKTLKSL